VLTGFYFVVWQDPLLVSSDVTQKDAFHSASTTSNLGTHVRTHGIVDLMVIFFVIIGCQSFINKMGFLIAYLLLIVRLAGRSQSKRAVI
jgi:hypothetical protein